MIIACVVPWLPMQLLYRQYIWILKVGFHLQPLCWTLFSHISQNEPFSTIHGAHGARIVDVHGFNAFAEILTETDFWAAHKMFDDDWLILFSVMRPVVKVGVEEENGNIFAAPTSNYEEQRCHSFHQCFWKGNNVSYIIAKSFHKLNLYH